MKEPKLSIITVNLNNASGLKKTIESVVSQTFTDYEYLVIDGGSTDGSMEVIKEFADKITFWVSEPDKGIYNAMNKGILRAKGEYLQFLNSGDWLVDDEILFKVFSRNYTEDILYGDVFLFYGSSKIKLKSFKNKSIDLQFLFIDTLTHQAAFIKRELFTNELYDERLTIVSDWKFFLEKIVIESVSIMYLDSPIVYYKMDGLSERLDMKQIIQRERQTVLQNLFPPLMLSALQELHFQKSLKPVAHVLEINKYKALRTLVFGFIRFALRGYQKIRGIKYK